MVLNEESQLDEDDWSNDWKDYTNKEKLEDATQIIRKEIMSLRKTYQITCARPSL